MHSSVLQVRKFATLCREELRGDGDERPQTSFFSRCSHALPIILQMDGSSCVADVRRRCVYDSPVCQP